MPIPNQMAGGQRKPTAQEMAGGIPQNADPGKMPMGLPPQGMPPMGAVPQQPPLGAGPPPMAAAPAGAPPMGQGLPAVGGGMPAMGGAPPQGGIPPEIAAQLQGNPQLLQALMMRQQAGGGPR